VAEWLAHPKRARWHLHFTPPVELAEPGRRMFSLLTKKRLQRGIFNSIDGAHRAIETWTRTLGTTTPIHHLTKTPKPS